MERFGHPKEGSRRKPSLLEEILSTLAFLILFVTGLSVLTGNSGRVNEFGSFVAVLFFVFGAYGSALDIIGLLDLLFKPVQTTSTQS
jgi:hypothetical protein